MVIRGPKLKAPMACLGASPANPPAPYSIQKSCVPLLRDWRYNFVRHPYSAIGFRSGRAKRETAKGRNRTRNAHFRRFSLIFGSLCKSRDLGAAYLRRKPQETAGNRRFSQETEENKGFGSRTFAQETADFRRKPQKTADFCRNWFCSGTRKQGFRQTGPWHA